MTTTLLRVKAIEGEPYRFHCSSDSLGAYPYLVDLESQLGRGECTCTDWQCRKHILMRNGETNPVLTSCKHVRRCWVFWARKELSESVGSDIRTVLESATSKSLMLWAISRIEKSVKEKLKQQKQRKVNE